MQYQSRKFSCGPATLANVLNLLEVEGGRVTEDAACVHTTEGTNERQLKAGIEKHGCYAEVHKGRDSLGAIQWLDVCVNLGTPVILCVDAWSHWVAVVGKLGSDYLVIDPADPELLTKLNSGKVSARWNHKKRYYGIAVVKPVKLTETYLCS